MTTRERMTDRAASKSLSARELPISVVLNPRGVLCLALLSAPRSHARRWSQDTLNNRSDRRSDRGVIADSRGDGEGTRHRAEGQPGSDARSDRTKEKAVGIRRPFPASNFGCGGRI